MALDFPLPPATFPASEQRLVNSNNNTISKRRRFQVPITRYFNAADLSSSTLVPDDAALSPPLSENIQSNLLTVGMRIRKSVPEGYKTSMLSKEEAYFGPSTVETSGSFSRNPTWRSELSPYCGLHKIGGLAVQPLPGPQRTAATNSSTAFSSAHSSITLSAAEQEDNDPFRSFPSSQESSTSNTSSDMGMSQRNKKRSLTDEEDDVQETNTLPVFQDPAHEMLGFSTPTGARIMAKPRSSRRAPGQQRQSSTISVERDSTLDWKAFPDQENSMSFYQHQYNLEEERDVRGGDGDERPHFDDFDEATFLRSREDVEMDVDM